MQSQPLVSIHVSDLRSEFLTCSLLPRSLFGTNFGKASTNAKLLPHPSSLRSTLWKHGKRPCLVQLFCRCFPISHKKISVCRIVLCLRSCFLFVYLLSSRFSPLLSSPLPSLRLFTAGAPLTARSHAGSEFRCGLVGSVELRLSSNHCSPSETCARM
jgi:hypothetical protein